MWSVRYDTELKYSTFTNFASLMDKLLDTTQPQETGDFTNLGFLFSKLTRNKCWISSA